jgi:heptosyltransferase II
LTSETVVVFAPNWLGDAVMALPAFADVRKHFASARVVVAARGSVASLFELVPGVDAVATLRWRGRPFTRRALDQDLATLNISCDSTPGTGILFPNSFATAWLARRAGVVERWGYATDWRRRLLTRSVKVPRDSMHQGRYYQHLLSELGVPIGPLGPRVDVPKSLVDHARDRLSAAGWDARQPLVAMAPGAAYGTAKRWLPKHFATVIATLANDYGVRTALVGSAADAETVRMIVADEGARQAQPIDLAGQTTLNELAGVLAASAACVSNDSGAMHLAGAVGTPLIALFGPTRESETAPLTRADGHREVLIHPVWCRPCMLRECPIDHRCMKGLEPARVVASLDTILSRPGHAEQARPHSWNLAEQARRSSE